MTEADRKALIERVEDEVNAGYVIGPQDARALLALARSSTGVGREDEVRDAVVAAFIAGAIAVHDAWIAGNGEREADFTEAAYDYADSLPALRTAFPGMGDGE